MQNVARLMGEEWLDTVRNGTGRRIHPFQFPLLQPGQAWERWRSVFDDAIGVVHQLVINDAGAHARLVAKIKSDFWSTVPEIIWAARLARLGATVTIEPLYPRKGPDMQFVLPAFSAHVEVYSPLFSAVQFNWGDDLRNYLAKLGAGFHASTQILPERLSGNLGLIGRQLRHVLAHLRNANNRHWHRLYMWSHQAHHLEPFPEDQTPSTTETDPIIDASPDPFFVADVRFEPGLGGVWVGSHTGASNALRDPHALLSDLGQLQAGANILIIDASRDWVLTDRIDRACNATSGAFQRHPELSAVAVSAWGVYSSPLVDEVVDEVFHEGYDLIPNPHASYPFAQQFLDELARPGLLGD